MMLLSGMGYFYILECFVMKIGQDILYIEA